MVDEKPRLHTRRRGSSPARRTSTPHPQLTTRARLRHVALFWSQYEQYGRRPVSYLFCFHDRHNCATDRFCV